MAGIVPKENNAAVRRAATNWHDGLEAVIYCTSHERQLRAVFNRVIFGPFLMSGGAFCMLERSNVLNVEAGWSGWGDCYVLFKSTHGYSGSEDVEQRTIVGSETSAAAKTRLGQRSMVSGR